ncbi:MAG TPA: Gfo/Idh/MocA family oxidoreductase [Planctomycetota bacterium]|nr:Gfo/Idh/MocA family oxidoreductase [Planctomycetota bacterium]
MSKKSTRREFLKRTAGVAGLSLAVPGILADSKSPNEKLQIGIIGTSGRAGENIEGVQGEAIVALADVDDRLLAAAAQRFPHAEKQNDFRKLLDGKGIDAVVVSTPDHTHAAATLLALRSGRHVYCEKPLAHSVHEARVVAETAARERRATQMGTQIHAGSNYRRVVELIRSGAIGPVHECHVWVGKTWSGGERPRETPPVPPHLHFDLWLGPAPERPYHPDYLPQNWRRWWDFGGGTLADMGCHYMDLAHWALALRHPVTVEAEGPPVHPETTPAWLIARYEYPARESLPGVKLTWYDGGKRPPQFSAEKLPRWGDGVLFVGEKGMCLSNYDSYRLLPEPEFAGFRPPAPTIPDSPGHYAEWITAAKTGSPTTCNFRDSGALAEAVLLGNVAYRSGKKLEWDAARLQATNCPDASRFIRREYRKGWSL